MLTINKGFKSITSQQYICANNAKVFKRLLLCLLMIFCLLSTSTTELLADDAQPSDNVTEKGAVTSDALSAPVSDLFTGTLSHHIPIEVPPGRNGMRPEIALTYHSNNLNGKSWVGLSWELELGAIERSTRNGVDYNGDDYVLHRADSVVELVRIADGEYRAKIEKEFLKINSITISGSGGTGKTWVITNTKGVKFYFGQTSDTRQDDPDDATREFKWCLDRVEDPNGNYFTVTYIKDQGQIYPDQILYASNDNSSISATNKVKFYREPNPTAIATYTTLFSVKTAYRLKTIDILANGNRVRSYKATYTGESFAPPVLLLAGFQQFGSDTVLSSDGTGTIVSGSSLPKTTFDYSKEQTGFKSRITHLFDVYKSEGYKLGGDFNGDGAVDFFQFGNAGELNIELSNKTGFDAITTWGSIDLSVYKTDPRYGGYQWTYTWFADFNADGKSDYLLIGKDGNLSVGLSTGTVFGPQQSWTKLGVGWNQLGDDMYTRYSIGNVGGKGKKSVIFVDTDGTQKIAFYNETTTCSNETCIKIGNGNPQRYRYADFNGDGKTDVLYIDPSGNLHVALSNGANFIYDSTNAPWQRLGGGDVLSKYFIGDFNGDGLADILYVAADHNVTVALSTGSKFLPPVKWLTYGNGNPIYYRCYDFNGDGKTDIVFISDYNTNNQHYVGLSTGAAFVESNVSWGGFSLVKVDSESVSLKYFDITGDGRMDVYRHNIACVDCDPTPIYVHEALLSYTEKGNLLTGISNGIGGLTQIEFQHYQDEFSQKSMGPLFVVKSIKTYDNSNYSCDANNYCSWKGIGNPAIDNYSYADGHYNFKGNEFRGFNYAKTSSIVGPAGEQRITETWFHQGDETAVGANNPDAAVGFMKGKPYRIRVSDNSVPQRIYSETETNYELKTSSPYYYAPPSLVDTYICDGKATASCKGHSSARQTTVAYAYDDYGNVIREDRYGDLSDPANKSLNMTITRDFQSNGASWLVSFPSAETVYEGIGTSDSNKIRHTDYYYDDLASSNCNATPTNNQLPTKGNLTRVSRWLKDGAPSETRVAYDLLGNPTCSRDPNGNVTTTPFDPTYKTFPASSTNAKSHKTTFSYYGVGTAADKGSFGQLKSITDPNAAAYPNTATLTYEYDPLGRKTKEIQPSPENFTTSVVYNSFGTVGTQNVYTSNQLGVWSYSYFDGLGRTVKERKSGPDNQVIVTETIYDQRGLVAMVSMPYFENYEPAVYRSYTHDLLGRVVTTYNPDHTSTMACYNDLVTARIDENGHKRRETRDPLGRLVTVEEYTGVYTTCDTSPGTPYASTTYSYDVLGNLTGVENAKHKTTTINYDTLGRKKDMTDPDMGFWQYSYYPDGTPYTITDAKGQTITFPDIDPLNRPTRKHYPVGSGMTDVVYVYDETTSANPLGHLTTMTDASGSMKYDYDLMGRAKKTVKRVGSVDEYTITRKYDGMGRLSQITYPDNEVLDYTYDLASNISTVGTYATFSRYNSVGQPRAVFYGNGVSTTYDYFPENKRPRLIDTVGPTQGKLISLSYEYYNNGNVRTITDNLNAVIPDNFVGEGFHPSSVKPHAMDFTDSGRSFKYDDNGNMTDDGLRSVDYNADNLPSRINGVVEFTYDGNGKRVKKSFSGNETVYIDNLYECVNDHCDKHIYAGDDRVAIVTSTQTFYHHADHLGSTSVVTINDGSKVESIAYYPFGETRQDNSSVYLDYKYTGQELDRETGLYNYGARLYDPAIGRFISADSIVPDPTNPQSFNRYAYVQNNPLTRIDPTGNFDFDFGGFTFCIFGCGDGGGGGGFSGGDSSSGRDYGIRLYQSPDAYDYNSYINNAGSDSNTSGPGYSGGNSSRPTLASIDTAFGWLGHPITNNVLSLIGGGMQVSAGVFIAGITAPSGIGPIAGGVIAAQGAASAGVAAGNLITIARGGQPIVNNSGLIGLGTSIITLGSSSKDVNNLATASDMGLNLIVGGVGSQAATTSIFAATNALTVNSGILNTTYGSSGWLPQLQQAGMFARSVDLLGAYSNLESAKR